MITQELINNHVNELFGQNMHVKRVQSLSNAGEEADLEKTIKANTSKTRSYSLFRQGCIYYQLLPNMREEWAAPLMNNFYRYLKSHRIYRRVFGIL
ncbi:hypothetical protein VTH8203_04473 [Vibrio thalassae]|uniref:Uncharacterized protein n=1 Tax=Vibrio thalassae TaxID=1243014 RepID=A0A240ERA3_9VIBR|nr:hypothetical protein VTH8203_04473 [Vibrio thalassae]